MIELYCQVGPNSLAQRVRLDMLEQLVSEPFYDTLRTKEQLGYSVHCSTRLTHGILGFAFVVVSGGVLTCNLTSRRQVRCLAGCTGRFYLNVARC